jgi:hypothetical protein
VEALLRKQAATPVKVIVVWERVLMTDRRGVRQKAVDKLTDRRAVHFWDPERRVSSAMGGPEGVAGTGAKVLFEMGEVVWDFAAVYSPGEHWQDGKAKPAFAGGQVENVIAEVEKALLAERGKGL